MAQDHPKGWSFLFPVIFDRTPTGSSPSNSKSGIGYTNFNYLAGTKVSIPVPAQKLLVVCLFQKPAMRRRIPGPGSGQEPA